jgi:hypothetical protein
MNSHHRRYVLQIIRSRDAERLAQMITSSRRTHLFISFKEHVEASKTALMVAAEMGWTEGVRLLLPHSDARHRNHAGESALILATLAKRADAECVRLLARAGDPLFSYNSLTPLQWAAKKGDLDKVRVLLPLSNPRETVGGAEPRPAYRPYSRPEQDALSLAIRHDHAEVAELLALKSAPKAGSNAHWRAHEAAEGLAPRCLSRFLADPAFRPDAGAFESAQMLRVACSSWIEGLESKDRARHERQARAIKTLACAHAEHPAALGVALNLARACGKAGLAQALFSAVAEIEADTLRTELSSARGAGAVLSQLDGEASRPGGLRL